MEKTGKKSINILHKESFNKLEHFAVWITKNIGSIGFFFLIIAWTVGWFFWNTFAPEEMRFDPFPAFVLWLFISNVLQLFLLPLLMIGQNLQSRHAEMRAEADFETNLQTERYIEAVLKKLDEHDNTLNEILKK